MTGKAVVCTVLLILAVATATSASSELQDEVHHRVLRESLECSPYNDLGSVCNSVLGAGNISTSGNVSGNDTLILQGLGNIEQQVPSLDSRCKQLYFAINCMAFNTPCGNNVWCTTMNRNELEVMVNESCPCTGIYQVLCTNTQRTILGRLQQLNLHWTDQAPAQTQCIDINIGEDIDVPTGTPPTTPPLPGIKCIPYDGDECSAVLAGQDVRSENYPQAESNVSITFVNGRNLTGGNLTKECGKSLREIMCSVTYFPCAGSVWCSSNGAVELATLFNNVCNCPEPVTPECDAGKKSVLLAVLVQRNISLFRTNQATSIPRCQNLSLGTQGSAAPTTSQTHFYTVFTAALMIFVGIMV